MQVSKLKSCKFVYFNCSSFQSVTVLKFQRFRNLSSCFLIGIAPISKILKNLLDGPSGLFGPCPFRSFKHLYFRNYAVEHSESKGQGRGKGKGKAPKESLFGDVRFVDGIAPKTAASSMVTVPSTPAPASLKETFVEDRFLSTPPGGRCTAYVPVPPKASLFD